MSTLYLSCPETNICRSQRVSIAAADVVASSAGRMPSMSMDLRLGTVRIAELSLHLVWAFWEVDQEVGEARTRVRRGQHHGGHQLLACRGVDAEK